MAEFVRRFDDPFGELMQRMWERSSAGMWPQAASANPQQPTPAKFPVNIYEDSSSYYITCVVPGLRADSIEVTAEGNVLTVAGRYEPHVPDGAKALVQEMAPAPVRRQFTLGAGLDPEGISARYENGLLYLVLSKAAHQRTRRIPVTMQTGSEQFAGVHANGQK